MKHKRSLSELFITLWHHLAKSRKIQFKILIVFMLLASIAEVVSIGAVIPFLTVLADPALIYEMEVLTPFITVLDIKSEQEMLLPISILFSLAAIAAGALRLILLWVQTRLSHAIGADLSISIFRKTLYQDYAVHISRNSSEVVAAVATKTTNVVRQSIWPLLNIISSTVIVMAILTLLLIINFKLSIIAFTCLAVIYILIVLLSRRRLNQYSKIIANNQNRVYKSLQEGLNGIRDVLIDGNQEVYVKHYSSADIPLRRAMAFAQIIGNSPRFFVEALGITVITAIAYYFVSPEKGIQNILPVIGTLALGAQRLLPLIQQIYSSWAAIMSGYQGLEDVVLLLEQDFEEPNTENDNQILKFKKEIAVKGLKFSYFDDGSYVIDGIDFTIKQGTRVGIIGASGSGKSTLLDIIMGLLVPQDGQIKIDGTLITKKNMRNWQKNVAHVPQEIFMIDATIAQNIAFGVKFEDIDMARVYEVSKQAEIHDFIMDMEDEYNTMIGEKGERLSGGQKQRIGIARALYKSANVLVLDEATSALDNETERQLVENMNINGHNLTTIIVAHRLSSLQYCDVIIELTNGKVSNFGTYENVVGG